MTARVQTDEGWGRIHLDGWASHQVCGRPLAAIMRGAITIVHELVLVAKGQGFDL